MAFIKRKEDFVCEKCGTQNIGNGFTNHCFKCLWSKHVDNDPGDRLAKCGGLMEPVGMFIERGENRILYRCVKCGFERKNRISKDDSPETVIDISKKPFIC